jgi:hypothetical protein
MSLVVVEHVNIIDPVGPFLSPFVIDIVFECFEALKDGTFFLSSFLLSFL